MIRQRQSKSTRRDFLRVGTAGLGGLSLAGLLGAADADARTPLPHADEESTGEATATNVIVVWLAGGPATIDMWDLKPEAPERIRGEFTSIETPVEGLRISEHLPRMAEVMDRVTLVRSVTHTIAAHGPGTEYVTSGNRPNPAVEYPSIGSLTSKILDEPAGVPSYMTLGPQPSSTAGFLGAAHNPFVADGFVDRRGRQPSTGASISLPEGFTVDDLNRRARVLEQFDQRFRTLDEADLPRNLARFQQRALDILRSDKTRQALDLSEENERLEQDFGFSAFGRSALAARRLIEAGVRCVTIGMGGWDTHSANFAQLQGQLLPQLDRGLASLIADLDERGLLDSTVVYCAGEFGRTPNVNGTAGRDHWARSMSVLLAGGGFGRGVVYGSTDRRGMEPASHACSPDDICATIFNRLGVGPQTTVTTNIGRPMMLFRDGKVLGL